MGDDAFEEGTAQLQTGVCISFDEPRAKSLINHEIQAKYFKIIPQSFRIQVDESRFDQVSGNALHIKILTLILG